MSDTSFQDEQRHEAQMIALYKFEEIIEKIGAGGPSLRDRFAMAALTGLLMDATYDLGYVEAAMHAYKHADAMLIARASAATKGDG